MILELSPQELPGWSGFAGLPDLEKSRLGPQSPWLAYGKLRTFVLEDAGRALARLTAMVNPQLQDQAVPTGLVGFLAFADEAFADPRATELLARARAWLAAQGMKRVRGPMNFCTWYSYRAETWAGEYPRFPGEDMLDARYAAWLAESMQPLGTYASQLIEDPEKAHEIARQLGVVRAGKVAGITVEDLPREQALADLRPFFDLAAQIFPQDYSYGPIGYEEFRQLYVPAIQRLPEFRCLIARARDGKPVGLAYGYQHPFAPAKTHILKTVGVLPEFRRGLSRGVSWYLTYRYHLELYERGYRQFIHSTMKEDNTSRAMSSRFATRIREYTLYEGEV